MRYIVTTKNTNLNIRSKPEASAPIIGSLAKGSTVDVSAKQDGFAKLARGGWASLSYLQPVSSVVSPVGPPAPVYAPLPDLATLWNNYPRDHDPEVVKRAIGGAVNAAWIKNTCAIRLSKAFNLAGQPIPADFPGMNTLKGEDGKNYAYRVIEMANYLEKRFGPPAIRMPGGTEAKRKLAGQKGIIMYDVPGWSNATGHLDMWNGRSPAVAEYFGLAQTVALWK